MSSIAAQANGLLNLLDGAIDNAPAYIAADFVNAWEILLNRPGTCKIAILFEEEKARSNFPGGDITGRVNRYFDVIISRGRGLAQIRSQNLTDGVGGGLPLWQLAEAMRDKIRLARFGAADEPTDYMGMGRWGRNDGFNIDAFKVSVWIGTQLGLPTALSPTGTPI